MARGGTEVVIHTAAHHESPSVVAFRHSSVFDVPAAELFGFHERPDAFEILQPPWQKTRILQPPTSLEVGTEVILKVGVGPFWQTVEAVHEEYEPGVMFADRMVRGPFRSWYHRHLIEPVDDDRSRLTDAIEYELPLGGLGRVFGGPIARWQLRKLFTFRHEATAKTLGTAPPRTD